MGFNLNKRFKKALVTGGSAGIGQAIIAALLKEGLAVTAVSRRGDGVPSGAEFLQADLSDDASIVKIETKIRSDNFDLIINAAGGGECLNFDEITPLMAENAWKLMVEAPRRISVAALPSLQKSGGALVNISSLAAEFPLPYMALYNSAKAALSALTLSMTDEYPKLQIIDLRPGDIKTNFAKNWKIPSPKEGKNEKGEKEWAATAAHMKKMIDEAPGPEVLVKALFKALKSKKKGTLRAGDFLQTVLMPMGARLAPTAAVNAVRRAYLKR